MRRYNAWCAFWPHAADAARIKAAALHSIEVEFILRVHQLHLIRYYVTSMSLSKPCKILMMFMRINNFSGIYIYIYIYIMS